VQINSDAYIPSVGEWTVVVTDKNGDLANRGLSSGSPLVEHKQEVVYEATPMPQAAPTTFTPVNAADKTGAGATSSTSSASRPADPKVKNMLLGK